MPAKSPTWPEINPSRPQCSQKIVTMEIKTDKPYQIQVDSFSNSAAR
jgi:hypothetical protein